MPQTAPKRGMPAKFVGGKGWIDEEIEELERNFETRRAETEEEEKLGEKLSVSGQEVSSPKEQQEGKKPRCWQVMGLTRREWRQRVWAQQAANLSKKGKLDQVFE
mmetsp:Transcript_40447/g.79735  ORF Transcript_40447/g.79735 Transcript_40447/m.79735 type:complete len:105 (-) Transcript_40447:1457-1771(-)